MDEINQISNARGLIRVEHRKHGSRAMLWVGPELERVEGVSGEPVSPIETIVRPYLCVICECPCALPNISPVEKKEMGKEWMAQNQSQTEIGGTLLCSGCRTTHPKIRIDSYRVQNIGEKCACTWDGCVVDVWQETGS